MKELKFEPHNEWGDLMTLQDFLGCVECGAFIDYDGYGELATATTVSNIEISPSEVKRFEFPEWATHILWYNR